MGLKISKWPAPAFRVRRRVWKAEPWPRGMVRNHPHMVADPWVQDGEIEIAPKCGVWAIRDPAHPARGSGILTSKGQRVDEAMMVRILIGRCACL